MKRLHRLLAALSILYLVTLGLATAALAYAAAPVGDPAVLGFSSSRLARIAAWQQSQVDAGAFSGAVAAIARNGKVAYLRAVGFRDRAKTIPLQPDAIFWIASMTKPVTSVAAMMLVEEGKLDLAAPVHRYLPEFRDVMVGVEIKDPVTGKTDLALEPQKRPMTVEDLLRHTAGLVYGVGNTKVEQLYSSLYGKAGVYRRDKALADFVTGLVKLPLAHQPGEVWDYGISVDVLSRVVEVASGQPFDQFLETRLFRPLGMVDTGFYVPEAKLSRLVDPPAGGRGGPPDSVLADVTQPTKLFSGGGGLVSTAADYLRFGQMLLNRGELDGVRILSPATVKQMTTNALPSLMRHASCARCATSWPGRPGGASACTSAPVSARESGATGSRTSAPCSSSSSRDCRSSPTSPSSSSRIVATTSSRTWCTRRPRNARNRTLMSSAQCASSSTTISACRWQRRLRNSLIASNG